MKAILLRSILLSTALLMQAGCENDKPALSTDLNVALDAAAAAEGAYASKASADPKVVAELSRLLATAQAAVLSWQSSTSPAAQAVANAAVSALFAYEAAVPTPP